MRARRRDHGRHNYSVKATPSYEAGSHLPDELAPTSRNRQNTNLVPDGLVLFDIASQRLEAKAHITP